MPLYLGNIDEELENADWPKTLSWDLPPYKSEAFLAVVGSLTGFKQLPLYKAARRGGLISAEDTWIGPEGGYCSIPEESSKPFNVKPKSVIIKSSKSKR